MYIHVAFCETEQTLFASFSGKRRILLDKLVHSKTLLRSRTTLFASFSGKRRIPLNKLVSGHRGI
jgi:hypothetical protein